MRRLIFLLSVMIVGCESTDRTVQDPKVEQEHTRTAGFNSQKAIEELERLGARIVRDENRIVVEIKLSETKVTDSDLVHLAAFDGLQRLHLDGTRVGDLSPLKELSNLRLLWLHRTKISDAGLEVVSGLSELEELDLVGTNITDFGLEHLQELKNLKRLALDYTSITDVGLKHLKMLTSLEVLRARRCPKITDSGLQHLKELKNLRILWLDYTHTSEDAVDELHQALPRCKIQHHASPWPR